MQQVLQGHIHARRSSHCGAFSLAVHYLTTSQDNISPMTRCSSEHVCERERRSSTSSIISPLWRRESVSAVSVPSQSPTVARIPLDTVVSGASVEDLDEKNACTSEQPNDATATLTRPKTKTQVEPRKRLTRGLPRRSDPECGGVVAHHKGRSWSRWAAEDVASPALVPALVTQALATG